MNYLYSNYTKWQSRFILNGAQILEKFSNFKNEIFSFSLFIIIKYWHIVLTGEDFTRYLYSSFFSMRA